MSKVIIEMKSNEGWRQIGLPVTEKSLSGSFSNSDVPEQRDVFIFGWLGDGVGPGVWRSTGGVDIADTTFRAIVSEGLERVADLTTDTPVIDFWRGGKSVPVRFRLVP